MPATPMTAASDVFDGLVTPAVAGAVAGAAAVVQAHPSGTVAGPGSAAQSDFAGGMDAEPDVFDFLQTPAPGSPANGAAPAGAPRGSAAKAGAEQGDAAEHDIVAHGGASPAATALDGAASVAAGRRPGFHLDVNQLAECSESGEPRFS